MSMKNVGVLLLTLTMGAPAIAADAGVRMASTSPLPQGVVAYGYADLVEKLLPAVVNVSATQVVGKESAQGGSDQGVEEFMQQFPPGSPFEDFFKDFLERHGGMQQKHTQASLGSGFVIDADKGYVITNNHVVDGADEVDVIFQDDATIQAKVVGVDAKTDLAVLKIPTDKHALKAVPFGNSDTMRVGDPVLAIGNPFGLGGSVSSGIISARARNINSGPYDDFFQTDAAINRGNSGGPMFNMKGEVIGVNTAIFSPTGGSVGIGFAIPSNIVKTVADQIIEYGQTRRGWIGVKIQQVTEEIADSIGLGKPRGVLVASVTDRGPAIVAGLQQGDVILSFDGKDIDNVQHLPRLVAETAAGKEVSITIWRKGQTLTKTIKVGSLEKAEKAGYLDDRHPEDGEPAKGGEGQILGLTLDNLKPDLRQQFHLGTQVLGVVVANVDPDSAAADKHIAAGDVIVEVNQHPVKSAADVLEFVAASRREGHKSVLLLIQSHGDLHFVALPLDEKKPSPSKGEKKKEEK